MDEDIVVEAEEEEEEEAQTGEGRITKRSREEEQPPKGKGRVAKRSREGEGTHTGGGQVAKKSGEGGGKSSSAGTTKAMRLCAKADQAMRGHTAFLTFAVAGGRRQAKAPEGAENDFSTVEENATGMEDGQEELVKTEETPAP